ncbi:MULTISPECIES: hypothetical protein [Pseudomonas]|uniref:hypothetical protein n=1 Tax=Pseudomonas TaxID=286 RepID=UPI0018D8CC01|nr:MULTISPECIES: hypothetical protein [Pseudomonas]MBH3471678.1 hypothetical protein [Pseudomonas putida]MDH1573681.1 hypothetical protein [Pseudomonas sp. GD03746]MDI9778024.1 hypothetical protein [Pseudomonas putida]
MTTTPTADQIARRLPGGFVVPFGWPCCDLFRPFSEAERCLAYEWAKQQRALLEQQGWTHEEPYDQFVQRITAELEI